MLRMAVLVTVLAGGSALACGACGPELIISLKNNTSDVPTNLVVRVQNLAPTASEYVLHKLDGTQVPLLISTGPRAAMWSIAPETPLEPMTAYELLTAAAPIHFTTGPGEDHTPPIAPVLHNVTHRKTTGGPCGGNETWTLELEGGFDNTTQREQLLMFVQTSGSNEPADARGMTTPDRLVLSTSCDQFTPPKGDSFPIAVQLMDLAGNVSELSEEKRAPACSVSLSGSLIILSLALLRRRQLNQCSGVAR